MKTLSTPAVPHRILVATDLCDTQFLLPHAIVQAQAAGACVSLLNAVPQLCLVPTDPASIPYVDGPKILRDTRLLMLGMAKQFEAAGVECDVVCTVGDPVPVIQQELADHGAGRLIMGTHGRGKLGQFTLGSVAHDLLAKLDIPIFVVGNHAHGAPSGVPKHILHPVSLNGTYRETVRLALDIALAYQASLTLLYVFNDDIHREADPARRVKWARAALQNLVPDDVCLSIPVHTVAAFGKIADEIVTAAAEHAADCIVMGVHAGTPVWSFQEATAYQVIAKANCPVLTLRHRCSPAPVAKAPILEAAADQSTPWIATAGIF